MSPKTIIYIIIIPLVIIAIDAININGIFKKNKVFQARLFLLFIILSLAFLLTNFIYDIGTNSGIFN